MKTYKFGAMSTVYSLEAPSNLVAIASMIYHYDRSAHLVVVYEPKGLPSWVNLTGKISDRLDEIFSEYEGFDKFIENHIEPIKSAMKTIREV